MSHSALLGLHGFSQACLYKYLVRIWYEKDRYILIRKLSLLETCMISLYSKTSVTQTPMACLP